MREDFLHFLWQFKKIPFTNLTTTDQEQVVIRNWGFLNKNAGPDFKECVVEIGNTKWAGQVEMHLNASDWNKHKHQNDKAYNNVILHVVWNHDEEIYVGHNKLPTLELKGLIPGIWISKYQELMKSNKNIPCSTFMPGFDSFKWSHWLERLAVERIESKCDELQYLMKATNNDLERVVNNVVAKSFGMKINQDPFSKLALRFPFEIILKNNRDQNICDSLVFGMSDWLGVDDDSDYWQRLKKEYEHLSRLYKLNNAVNFKEWLFSRLRPSNFASIRLAQWSGFINNFYPLYPKIQDWSLEDWKESFNKIETNPYWDTHYQPGKTSITRVKKVGESFTNNVIINGIVPMTFLVGIHEGKQNLKDKAVEMLTSLSSEKNAVTKKYEELNKKSKNAAESQAQIQLYKYYCQTKKCLSCPIGISIVNK